MRNRTRAGAVVLTGLCLALGCGSPAFSQTVQKGEGMSKHATGTFEVKLSPQATAEKVEGLGRMSIDKQFHGDLEATSQGEMLTAGTVEKGSAGYVAIEWVSGSLHGRTGTFALQHTGTMNRGVPSLSVTVVPDSGTGQLAGLSGTLKIIIADGKHSYDFDYAIAGAP